VIAERFLVGGRVQGVSFRAFARAQAQALGVTGHARNLPDGRVEVIGFGTRQALDALAAWLAEGSPAARVESVERSAWPQVEAPDDFRIG
jgi:acylphosphatase